VPSQFAGLPHRSRGLTAIELLTTLAIIAMVTAIAVPGMREFVQNSRASADANALIGALAIARNEAINRGVPVSVCPSADGATCTTANPDDWSSGWIVFTDAVAPAGSVDDGAPGDQLLRAFPALESGSELTSDATFVRYQANGFLAGGAAANFSLDVPDCTGDHGRAITINLQGRAGVTHESCG
jgi:type IV fimbrial biogenesis protein FimT